MTLALLKNDILPAAFNKGNSKFVECELDEQSKCQDQFQSNVVFLTVIVRHKENEERIPLLAKFEPTNQLLRAELKTEIQFHNEVLMYSKLFPLLDKLNHCEDFFPKFYYGLGTIVNPEKNVILLEDLSTRGFKLSEKRCFLDYKHLEMAMKNLGSFHALSYIAKHESPEEFYRLANELKETRWLEGVSRPFIVTKACFHRAIDPLVERGIGVKKLSSIASRMDKDIMKFFEDFLAPEEPLAVLCHGDFCRNNTLFKYEQGFPVDVRFFDVAAARYTSPAVDIALMLLINCSNELRMRYWDDLMRAYYTGLYAAGPSPYLPSLDDVQMEMRKKTLNGFIHCCYFLPLMLFENDVDMAEIMNAPPEHVATRFASFGGFEGTKLLTDMAEELLERDCLNG